MDQIKKVQWNCDTGMQCGERIPRARREEPDKDYVLNYSRARVDR